jgi:hypothetical protein
MHDLPRDRPAAELSLALAAARRACRRDEEPDTSWMPPRRLGAVLLVGAGLAAAAFGIGYVAGQGGSDSRPAAAPPEQTTSVVALRPSDQNNTSGASIRLGRKRTDGNWPMIVTVRGLDHLVRGDYYALVLTRNGTPAVTCGTFNVAQEGTTSFRMIAAYDLDRFDGWAITEWDAQTRSERRHVRSRLGRGGNVRAGPNGRTGRACPAAEPPMSHRSFATNAA